MFDASVDAEEEIFDFVARMQVDGHPQNSPKLSDDFAASKGVTDPAVCLLVRKGLSSLLSDFRFHTRLRLKVMKIDPEFYERMAKSQIQPSKSAVSRSRRREEKNEEQSRLVKEMYGRWEKKQREMMAFYDLWHMPDGTALGDATREKLLSESARERALVAGHERNATFYDALANEMSSGEIVRDTVSLVRAHQLRESIFITSPAE